MITSRLAAAWSCWRRGFEEIGTSAEGGLLAVAEEGIRQAEERIEQGRDERRSFELTGRFTPRL